MTYESDESGRQETYVQAYPGPGIKRRVSTDGGTSPFWSHSGRELFYLTATAMFRVPILDAHDLHVGAPERLFAQTDLPGQRVTVSANDQRFLMLERATASPSQLNVVQNWFEELKQRVPTK